MHDCSERSVILLTLDCTDSPGEGTRCQVPRAPSAPSQRFRLAWAAGSDRLGCASSVFLPHLPPVRISGPREGKLARVEGA